MYQQPTRFALALSGRVPRYGPIKDKAGFVPDRKVTRQKTASDKDGPLEKATA